MPADFLNTLHQIGSSVITLSLNRFSSCCCSQWETATFTSHQIQNGYYTQHPSEV